MTEATPLDELVVGEKFWLGKGREMVESAVAKRETAAERITVTLTWFWTVYSAAALVSTPLVGARPVLVAVLLALPTILLIIAYITAASVAIPVKVNFDPRVPGEIEKAFWNAAKSKRMRLYWAHGLMIVAATCVTAGIIGSILIPARPANASLSAQAVPTSNGASVVVAGAMPPGVTVLVSASVASTPNEQSRAVQKLVTVPRSGHLDTTLDLPKADRYRISASWPEGDLTKTLERQLGNK